MSCGCFGQWPPFAQKPFVMSLVAARKLLVNQMNQIGILSSQTFSDVKVIPYVFSNNCVIGNSWFIYSNQLVEYDLDNFLVGTTKMHAASCTLKSRSLRTMKAAISSFCSAAQQPGELCVVVFISSVLIRHLAFIRKFVGLL